MPLGILQDSAGDHVPGTTKYFDDPERPQYARDGAPSGLKCDTSGPVPIVLVPQPSDDPNDPLNWPLWKRDLITFILSLTAIFATSLGPILAANTITLTTWYLREFDYIAQLTGYFLLGSGVSNFFFVPSGRIWGKRHLFVLGTLILIGSSLWAALSGKNYDSMIGARVIQGVGAAPFETLVNAAVGDLYFVHQRGKRMAFTNLAVFGGAFFTPVVVGKITETMGFWWSFYFVAIFCAVCLPFVFFFCPETAYNRDPRLNTDIVASPGSSTGSEEAKENGSGDTENGQSPADKSSTHLLSWRSLSLFNGRKTDEQFWKLLLRPLPLFFHPVILWACLVQGTMIGWTVFIGVSMAQFLFGFPYWFGEAETGYTYVSAFIGALLGFAIAGILADWSAKKLTKKNGGVYEPEFRILLTIPQLILGCAGLYGWGITADGIRTRQYPFVVALVFFALEVAGMVVGAVASSLYIVDAYRGLAIEAFTCMIVFKNMFSFALTYKAFTWLEQNQTKAEPIFKILGTVQLLVCLTSIPLYIFGKRLRSFFSRHDPLAMLGLR